MRKRFATKKKKALDSQGKLLCEACDFDFASIYGILGVGFAECHHRVPVASFNDEHTVRLEELVIVCAICHHMLHRIPFYTVE